MLSSCTSILSAAGEEIIAVPDDEIGGFVSYAGQLYAKTSAIIKSDSWQRLCRPERLDAETRPGFQDHAVINQLGIVERPNSRKLGCRGRMNVGPALTRR